MDTQVIIELASFCKSDFALQEVNSQGCHDVLAHLCDAVKVELGKATGEKEDYRELLDKLDPGVDTIPFTLLIAEYLNLPKAEKEFVADDILKLFALFHPIQIRFVLEEFAAIIDFILDFKLFPPTLSIPISTHALLRLDPTVSTLTPLLIRLTTLSYQTSETAAIIPLLIHAPTLYPGQDSVRATNLCLPGLTPTQYLRTSPRLWTLLNATDVNEFEFTRGLIFCREGLWRAACGAFSRGAAFPYRESGMISRIGLECFRRWIICELLDRGVCNVNKLSCLPAPRRETYGSLLGPYITLASTYKEGYDKLLSHISSFEPTWESDSTTSLIQQLPQSFIHHKLSLMPNTYINATISQIHAYLSKIMAPHDSPPTSEIPSILSKMTSLNLISAEHVPETESSPAYIIFHPLSPKINETLSSAVSRVASSASYLDRSRNGLLARPGVAKLTKALLVKQNGSQRQGQKLAD